MQNKKLKDKSDNKCKRDKSSSSAKPEIASSSASAPQRVSDVRGHSFTFRELATATNNFKIESLIGRGGFGGVYKGRLESIGQDVAVKMLDKSGPQGDKELLVEVLKLSLLDHENLVTLFGYCAGDQRLLVYKYMPLGSVDEHLHVVMLELITGRKTLLVSSDSVGQGGFLVNWAHSYMQNETMQIVDPKLYKESRAMKATLRRALEVAFMCLREDAYVRPSISEVVEALD